MEFDPISAGIAGVATVVIANLIRVIKTKKVTGYYKCKQMAKANDLKGNDRKRSIYKCQLGIINKELVEIKNILHKCDGQKNPERCRTYVGHQIAIWEEQKQKIKEKLRKLN